MSNSYFLARIKHLIFSGVPMPVVTIKLDNGSIGWDEGIYGKFSVNNILRYKINPHFIQYRVSEHFKLIRICFRLCGAHFNQSFCKLGIFVPAFHRTILPIIIDSSRWGNFKTLIANLARKSHLISSLPFIAALQAASDRCVYSICGNVKRLPTLYAYKRFTSLRFVLWLMGMVTLWRTKFNILRAAFCNHNAAPNTFISSNSIFHRHSVPQKTAKSKPIYFYQWLLKNYAKPGDKILDTHGGSCSLAIACDIMGFDATIYEIDKDYYEAAVDRFNRHKQQATLNFGG